jgi:formamidopyrimidine-DNA glycosylase
MPELPEVETVVSDLNKKIKGNIIVDFWSEWPKALKNITLQKFTRDIKNRKILGARRIGKNIFIDLSGGKTLYIHLKMTGHLLVKEKDSPHPNPLLSKERELDSPSPLQGEGARMADEVDYFSDRVNQYVRHKFFLNNDKVVEFSDVRKFAKIVLDSTENINNLKEIKALGIDAMDEKFNFQKFSEILNKKPQIKIGILLMDQNVIAGIGNIYRSEILFDAGILPERKSADIKLVERKKLFQAIKKILKLAIKMRGTSDSDYRDTSGAPGNFQKVLKVYRKDKLPCPKCKGKIERGVLAQRAVFFCGKCQN